MRWNSSLPALQNWIKMPSLKKIPWRMAILDSGSSSLKYDILQDYGWVLKKNTTSLPLRRSFNNAQFYTRTHTMKAGTGRRLGLSSRFPGGWDFGFIFILSDLYTVIALGSADYFFFPLLFTGICLDPGGDFFAHRDVSSRCEHCISWD